MKKPIIINIIVFILTIVAVVWMMTDNTVLSLSARKLQVFRYFTVDSNILMGISAVVMATAQIRVLNGKSKSVVAGLYVLKLVSTVTVTITMLVTVFYLGFIIPTGFLSLFVHSNFIMHLVVPVLGILVFILYEKTNSIKLKHIFFSLVPLVLYGIYYAASAYSHMENGVIANGYDWYWFFSLGASSVLLVYPFFAVFTLLLSYVLWKLNKTALPLSPPSTGTAEEG